MASRAIWKGQLRLSLVSISVEIHSATKTARRISFRQIHGPSGKPIRYEKTVAGIGPVDKDEIMKGYALGDNEYLLIDPEEIDAIKLETKKTFEMVQFVGHDEISPLYYDQPYYIVPTDELAEDAYRVVRDALRRSGKVGLGQLTIYGSEKLCAVRPCGDGLLMETLFYADEIKDADPLFASIEDDEVDQDLLTVAEQLIEKKTAPFDAAAFTDNYDKALRALIEDKRKGRAPRVSTEGDARPSGDNVVDLMQALRDSLKASGGASSAKAFGGASAGSSTAKPTAKSADAKSSTSKATKSSGTKAAATKSSGRKTAAKTGDDAGDKAAPASSRRAGSARKAS
ncbi:Ku protein [uncultured Paracoccus sp.]|uniref:non-homologous end joining protein Ku n=1 Tax=uncultured Paracoccus sp. TaxID=189685 RepID=UPI002634A198|nr:Ku protein [uncultured Paracoccus sp.]